MGEWESGGIRDAVEIPSSCSSSLPLFHSSTLRPILCEESTGITVTLKLLCIW